LPAFHAVERHYVVSDSEKTGFGSQYPPVQDSSPRRGEKSESRAVRRHPHRRAGTTRRLAQLKAGDSLANLAGPLGVPTHIEKFGAVICVTGGVGVAPIVPIARALKEAGNNIISILGARSKNLVFWEEELKRYSDRMIVTTDDGSYGRKGLVTEPLKEILESGEKIDRVFAIGPAIMMRFSAKTTEPFGVKTIVSLNPIMVDGTGMCGACRISVGGKTKFTCVEGPDFDGHQVNWDELLSRQRIYPDEEKLSLENWQCKCGHA
jgi:ferredoxin--NADP+ reductase